MIIRGRVASGLGNFSFWIDHLADYYEAKTGMRLFPGTLNIELEEPYDLPKDGVIRFEAEEFGGTVSVSMQPCTIFDRSAFILRTDANAEERGHHRRTIIEIATDVKLRDAFGLQDGDLVEVSILD